ncbi:MAG: GTP-binding protein [Mycobacterium sp.]
MDTHHGHVPTLTLSGPLHDAPLDQKDAADPSAPHPHYESWSLTTETPLARADIEAFLAELPSDVLRAKGFVHLADDPDRLYPVQVVGRRSSRTGHRAIQEDRLKTRLMVIGLPGSSCTAGSRITARATPQQPRGRRGACHSPTRSTCR